jgi:hypothetical protein
MSLAIPNVSLHAEELVVYQRIAKQRPRTYLIVLDDWQDYQIERNLAIKVWQAVACPTPAHDCCEKVFNWNSLAFLIRL